MTKRNPESDVVDAIDELVDESLNHGPTDDYDRPWTERCELCSDEWHGLEGNGEVGVQGCPGAYATDEQIERWREWWGVNRPPSSLSVDYSATDYRVIPFSPIRALTLTACGYTLADIEAMRGRFLGTLLGSVDLEPFNQAIRDLNAICEVRCQQCRRYMPHLDGWRSAIRETYTIKAWCRDCSPYGEYVRLDTLALDTLALNE